MAASGTSARTDRRQIARQMLKAAVYTLLLVNFGYYIAGDWSAAQLKLEPSSSLIEWSTVYATTLNEIAWFVLLLLFELETYWLSDRLGRLGRWLLHGTRLLCYGILLQTIVAYTFNLWELEAARPLPGVLDLCDLAGQGEYFRSALDYTAIELGNCAELASGGAIYRIGGDSVVADLLGLHAAIRLAWLDVIEAVCWLAIFVLIEETVWIQALGRFGSPLQRSGNVFRVLLYGAIIGIAGYWAYVGDWLSAWDEFLWIGGFAAIEMNLQESQDAEARPRIAAATQGS